MEKGYLGHLTSAYSFTTNISSLSTLSSDQLNLFPDNQELNGLHIAMLNQDRYPGYIRDVQPLFDTEQASRLPSGLTDPEWPLSLIGFNELNGSELILECLSENTHEYETLVNIDTYSDSNLSSPLSDSFNFDNLKDGPTIPSGRYYHDGYLPLSSISDQVLVSGGFINTDLTNSKRNKPCPPSLISLDVERSMPFSILPRAVSPVITQEEVECSVNNTPPLTPTTMAGISSFFRLTKPNRTHRRSRLVESRNSNYGAQLNGMQEKRREERVEIKNDYTEINICKFCQRPFKRKHDLQRHIRLHTGEKPFRCGQCTSAFSRTDTLRRHLRQSHGCFEHPMLFTR